MAVCPVPGCPTITKGGRCAQHQLRPDLPSGWGSAGLHRIRGRKLQRMRAELFRQEPLCRLCDALGLVTVATIRDHIVPLAEGGQDVASNTQPLCQTCSDLKTQKESLRARVR